MQAFGIVITTNRVLFMSDLYKPVTINTGTFPTEVTTDINAFKMLRLSALFSCMIRAAYNSSRKLLDWDCT